LIAPIRQFSAYQSVNNKAEATKEFTGNVLEMTTIFEPGATSGDVISCALALDLDQYREIFGDFTVPRQEGLE
jgi:hypothetical protein